MRALSIGRLVYDINILMDKYPVEGTENVTKEMINCSGGAANIIAYSLSKWNMESFISGVIGYDETGTTMKKSMEDNKVRTNYLETNYDIKTPTSYNILNKGNKTRTVIDTEINDFNIKKYEYDTDMDLVISDSYEYNASVYAFNKYSKAITILNAKNIHPGLIDFFKYVKYVVASSTVAEAITGLKIDFNNPSTIAVIYKKVVDKFPHINLLITIEGKGCVYSVNNEIKVMATMNTEIIDKTGARDIFVAMLGYGVVNSYDLETTIKLATIAEGMSKKTIGSTLSIPILSDIIKYYEEKFGQLKKLDNQTVVENIEQPTEQTVSTSNVIAEPPKVSDIPINNPQTNQNDENIVSQVFGTNPPIINDQNDSANR